MVQNKEHFTATLWAKIDGQLLYSKTVNLYRRIVLPELFTKHKIRRAFKRTLIVDTSLLLLLAIGLFVSSYIEDLHSEKINWSQFSSNVDNHHYHMYKMDYDMKVVFAKKKGVENWEFSDVPEGVNLRKKIFNQDEGTNSTEHKGVIIFIVVLSMFTILFIPLFIIMIVIEWYYGLPEK